MERKSVEEKFRLKKKCSKFYLTWTLNERREQVAVLAYDKWKKQVLGENSFTEEMCFCDLSKISMVVLLKSWWCARR